MKLSIVAMSMSLLLVCGSVLAQESPVGTFTPYTGEVAPKTLQIRSGPSTNYYPVTRLSAGARLQVIGEETGWLAVVPPPGCFSLIAARLVDRGDGASGVVNADNVRVRAGSDLSPHNYAIQLKLSKGALVKILGTMDAEFLKIEPPAGARLWASADYVRRVPEGLTGAESAVHVPSAPGESSVAAAGHPMVVGPTPAGAEPTPDVQASTGIPPAEGELPVGDDDASPPDPVPTPPTRKNEPLVVPATTPSPSGAETPRTVQVEGRQRELEALDQQLAGEMNKPILDRDLATLLPRYRQLAEQSGDEYIQAYARIRLQQVESALEMIEGVRTMSRLREEVQTARTVSLADRSSIRHVPVRTDGGFDVEGELRPSAVYESPVGPKRYRLVDANVSPARTLGYVEIPPGAEIDMSNFLGRRVGIRARDRILTEGDVDPLSIYVPLELAVIEQAADGSTRIAASVRIGPPPQGAATASRP